MKAKYSLCTLSFVLYVYIKDITLGGGDFTLGEETQEKCMHVSKFTQNFPDKQN